MFPIGDSKPGIGAMVPLGRAVARGVQYSSRLYILAYCLGCPLAPIGKSARALWEDLSTKNLVVIAVMVEERYACNEESNIPFQLVI